MFDFSEKSRRYQQQLNAFMAQNIYPREEEYTAQLHAAESRNGYLPIMHELKTKAQEAGSVEFVHSAFAGAVQRSRWTEQF